MTTNPISEINSKRDLKNLEFHILDTGHFALEEDGAQIASLIRGFLCRNVDSEK